MRVGAIPETLLERIATVAGLAPTPVVDTFHAVIVARAVVVATKLGVFDALADGPAEAPAVAARPPRPCRGIGQAPQPSRRRRLSPLRQGGLRAVAALPEVARRR